MCIKRLDLAILVDGSSSIGNHRFRRCVDFVKKLISSFHVQRRFVRVAVALFSTQPHIIFNFKKYNNRISAIRMVSSRVRFLRGGTRTGLALRKVARRVFNSRRRARRVLVVITNGRSQDKVTAAANYLKRNLGVKIIALGTGPKTNAYYLRQIASSRSHVFNIRGFRSLHSVVSKVKRKACGKQRRYFRRK